MGVRILCDGFRWLPDAAELASACHDVVTLDEHDVARAWADPRLDWWRALVPPGWEPDVALFTAPEAQLAPPHLDALPCPVALWVGDPQLNAQAVSWIADQADLLLADAAGVRGLRRAGIPHVAELSPWTYRPALHRPDPGGAPDLDVVAIGGAASAERDRWHGRLADLPDDLRVRIAPSRGEEADAALLRRARIVVEVSLSGDVTARCLQAAASGALVVVDAGAAARVERWFHPDREIVVAAEHELADRVLHLLRHEPERAAIAAAGRRRAERHGPAPRLTRLLDLLEGLAEHGRCRAGPSARAGGAAAAYALSVAPAATDLGGHERLLDAAEQAAPGDAALQVARARLYAFIAARGDERAAAALRWADDHLRQALALEPRDAVARLSRAQLAAAAGNRSAARDAALALADDLRAGRAVAHADRVPIRDPRRDQLLRQRAVIAGGDPRRELTRLTLVGALRLAAECTADPGDRAELLTEAVGLAPEDPSIRLDLAVSCFSLAPATAIAHTRLLLAAQPVNPAVWMLHAHALVAAGRHEEARAFGDRVERLARRVEVDDEHLARVRAAVALAWPHRALTPV